MVNVLKLISTQHALAPTSKRFVVAFAFAQEAHKCIVVTVAIGHGQLGVFQPPTKRLIDD